MSLSAFNAKLAAVARDYEILLEHCLFLQNEVSSQQGIHGHQVKANTPPLTPVMSGCLAETPRMPDEHEECQFEGSGWVVPPVPTELGLRLLVTPRLRCHGLGVASSCGNARSFQSVNFKEERKLEQTEIHRKAPSQAKKSALKESIETCAPRTSTERRSTMSTVSSRFPSSNSIAGLRESHWAYLSKRLLTGGRAWKLDPMWESNIGMRVALSDPTSISLEMGVGSAAIHAVSSARSMRIDASSKTSWFRDHLMPPFHPDATGKQIWDLFSILWLFQDLIMVPLVFFDSETLETPYAIDLSKVVFWTVDILLSCATGFYRIDGWLEMHPAQILTHYFKTHFLLDGTVVGMDWILIVFETQSSVTGMSRVLFRSIRALRLLRFRKGLQRTSIIADNFVSEYIIVRLDILKLLFLVALASHYIACIWYGLTRLKMSDTSADWAQVNLDDEGRNHVFYAYSTSLHWALTQFTPASMEVVPENTAERLFTCMVILIAMVVFSSFVSSIQQAMNYIRQLQHQKRLQECAIRTFFHQRNIAHDTCVKIWRFIKRHKLTDVSLVREDDLVVLKQLPSYLKKELRLKLYMPIMTEHPLFFVLHSGDPEFVEVVCNHCIKEVQIGVGTEAFTPGSEINDMIFVIRGMLEYVTSDDAFSIYVQANDWMCELSLWANGVRLPGVCYGDHKGAELVCLNSTRFRRSARKYSAHFNLLADYAIRFVTLFDKLSNREHGPVPVSTIPIQDSRLFALAMIHSESVLFNEYELITSIVEDAAESYPLFALEVEDLKTMRRRVRGSEPGLVQRVGKGMFKWYAT